MLAINGHGAFGNFGGAAEVTELQRALQGLGKLSTSSVTGSMNGATLAAVFDVIRERGAQITQLPDSVRSKFQKVNSLDSKIRSASFNTFGVSDLLKNATSVIAAVRAASDTAANEAQNGYDEFKTAVGNNAKPITLSIAVLKALTPTPTGGGSWLQQITQQVRDRAAAAAAGKSGTTITAFSPKLGKWRVATVSAGFGDIGLAGVDGCACKHSALSDALGTTCTEAPPMPAAPSGAVQMTEKEFDDRCKKPFYKRWGFWALIGGGAAATAGTVYVVRRKRSA